MKARQDFEIAVDKKTGARVGYYGAPDENTKLIKVKKGGKIPDKYLLDLIQSNIDYVDVEFKDGVPQIPKELLAKPVKEQKYTKPEFIALNREEQEKELKKLGIQFTPKDKEADLVKKYFGAE